MKRVAVNADRARALPVLGRGRGCIGKLCATLTLFVALAFCFGFANVACQQPVGQYRSLGRDMAMDLNVGILNDSRYPELKSAQISTFLQEQSLSLFASEEATAKSSLPPLESPLQFAFIVDQPTNVIFTFEETYFKKDAQAEFAQEIESIPSVTGSLSSSFRLWSLYMKQQVRYDIVFTNAPIAQIAGVQAWLVPTMARQSLENYGILLTSGGLWLPEEMKSLWRKVLHLLIFLTDGVAEPHRNQVVDQDWARDRDQLEREHSLQAMARTKTLQYFSLLQSKREFDWFGFFATAEKISQQECLALLAFFSRLLDPRDGEDHGDDAAYENDGVMGATVPRQPNTLEGTRRMIRDIARQRASRISSLTKECQE